MARHAKRIAVVSTLLAALWAAMPVYALEITFDNGSAGLLTIVDNGTGDLNSAVGVIDFATPAIGGIFIAEGRVQEDISGPVPSIVLTGIGTIAGTFRNVGTLPAWFTVSFSSTPFLPIGPMVRYRVGYAGSAEDPTPASVEIFAHQVQGWLNGFSVLLATLNGTAIPSTPPSGQPVPIGPYSTDGSVVATATTINGRFVMTSFAGDQINLPNSFEIVLNEQVIPVEETTWGRLKAFFWR